MSDNHKGKRPRMEPEDDEDEFDIAESEGEEEEDDGDGGEEGEEEEDEGMNGFSNGSYIEQVVPVVKEDDRPADSVKDAFKLCSQPDATEFMQWLIAPFPLEEFVEDVWERRPLLVKRHHVNPAYYDGWFSTKEVDRLLRDVGMKYKYNVDVTSYQGNRMTWNKNDSGSSEFADPDTVWRRYEKEGCSIRVLHPQRWCDPLWKMLAALERYWNCSVGCNTYLTPKNSQGFSPHWDDIEAIVLQIEGRKCWKVYRPRSSEEALPRYSSGNFEQDEIGEPILEAELGPGDLLYLPRGVIHQAESPEGTHSLHVTLSTNHFNTWTDLLEVALPRALELASAEVCALRTAPPRDYFNYMGVVHSDEESGERQAFEGMLMQLSAIVLNHLPVDATADQMAKRFIKQRLPPPPLSSNAGSSSTPKKLSLKSKIRLAYPNCARLCIEDDAALVYHFMDNPRLMHMEGEADDDDEGGEGDAGVGKEASGVLRFSMDHACAIEAVITLEDGESLPVRTLPADSEAECLEVASKLVDAGIAAIV